MRPFRLALLGLCIIAGVVGCANDDPWVGEWHVVVDIEAEVAELVEREEKLAEMLETNLKLLEELTTLVTEEEQEEIAAEMRELREPIDIEKEAEELAAELRAVPEDEGQFLTFERGRDGKLVAVFETRWSEDPADDTRMLSEDVTESSELIRCKFVDAESGITFTYELTLAGEDLLEGSLVVIGLSEKEPVKLERVR